ncbi:predicted protein [Uncinocarpus reesii 1704]|uniref:5-Methylcytosine G/T mismatch-specific DNA glycosylase n=1 Tax=Uncinocarpus reesii (strain UAMH 1704) TaxID=336963 RepID=C4JPE9_UNCRE|nr:uncharacterized protein UREG_04531 [Uncinocarpus reesii 1704]EEP79685.1 predicted protein [Uncinocarpus reesii 1704]
MQTDFLGVDVSDSELGQPGRGSSSRSCRAQPIFARQSTLGCDTVCCAFPHKRLAPTSFHCPHDTLANSRRPPANRIDGHPPATPKSRNPRRSLMPGTSLSGWSCVAGRPGDFAASTSLVRLVIAPRLTLFASTSNTGQTSTRHREHHRDTSGDDEPTENSTGRIQKTARRRRSSHGTSKRSSTASSTKRKTKHPDTARRSSSSISSLKNKQGSMGAPDPYAESLLSSRAGRPYPAFSKEHSKEAVRSRDNLGARIDILTPEPTDITVERTRDGRPASRNKNEQSKRQSTATNPTRLPSPPLTNDENQPSRRSTPSVSRTAETKGTSAVKAGEEGKRPKSRPHSTRSSSSLKRTSLENAQKLGDKVHRPGTPSSKFSIFDAFQIPHRSATTSSRQKQQTKDERAKRSNKSQNTVSPTASVSEDETVLGPRTSTASGQRTSSPLHSRNKKSGGRSETPTGGRSTPVHASMTNGQAVPRAASVNPPPPPPPPDLPLMMPKVDYLLQNGGLNHHVPRNFLGAGESANMPQQAFDPSTIGTKLFEPFSNLLDSYGTVLSKRGSLAVATGYRSVARRLLDRLEAVFARDISQEVCECFMCLEYEASEEASGVSWGEVLELVSGRSDLPAWPPFQIHTEPDTVDLGKTAHVPMQKLDIDVPKEMREHYLLHSRKTKQAIDEWLSRQTPDSTSPPDMVDDETLAFAMLTYLGNEQRNLFSKFLELPTSPPSPKPQTPKPRGRPEALVLAGSAIQRLYRLPSEPRDPDTALYLVNNPDMHHVLATLSAISNDEWDILISGRFDGFLRSGAEDNIPPTSATAPPFNSKSSSSRNGINGSRPASQPYGRRQGPASFGAPISVDEENEIATLAEIEREIYAGMEALEDAFEALHYKAEAIRTALRERGAGLSLANQARRGSPLVPGPNPKLPGFGSSVNGAECEMDDMIDDGLSSIAPSESASNISSVRRRRPKRRTERRTPSVVGEEDEGEHHLNVPRRTGTASSGRRR